MLIFGIRYDVGYEEVQPYRQMVLLKEIDTEGRPTGKIWKEPFDPIRGDWEQLMGRFTKRFAASDPPDIHVQASAADLRMASLHRNVKALMGAARTEVEALLKFQSCLQEAVDVNIPGGLAELEEKVLNRCSQVETNLARQMGRLEKDIRTAIMLEFESRKWGNRLKALVRRRVR